MSSHDDYTPNLALCGVPFPAVQLTSFKTCSPMNILSVHLDPNFLTSFLWNFIGNLFEMDFPISLIILLVSLKHFTTKQIQTVWFKHWLYVTHRQLETLSIHHLHKENSGWQDAHEKNIKLLITFEKCLTKGIFTSKKIYHSWQVN